MRACEWILFPRQSSSPALRFRTRNKPKPGWFTVQKDLSVRSQSSRVGLLIAAQYCDTLIPIVDHFGSGQGKSCSADTSRRGPSRLELRWLACRYRGQTAAQLLVFPKIHMSGNFRPCRGGSSPICAAVMPIIAVCLTRRRLQIQPTPATRTAHFNVELLNPFPVAQREPRLCMAADFIVRSAYRSQSLVFFFPSPNKCSINQAIAPRLPVCAVHEPSGAINQRTTGERLGKKSVPIASFREGTLHPSALQKLMFGFGCDL